MQANRQDNHHLLIAMSRCKILSAKDNVIEIESIDAFPDVPLLDLQNWAWQVTREATAFR